MLPSCSPPAAAGRRRPPPPPRRHPLRHRLGVRPGLRRCSAAPSAEPDRAHRHAKAEGTLTTIALPWCNYGEVIQSFKDKYGLAVNELNPGGSSGDEIEAIKASQDNPGLGADVVDVGFSFGEDNKDLFEPYKVATWDSIPGGQVGRRHLVRRLLRRHVVHHEQGDRGQPAKDWADLLKPEYKGGLDGRRSADLEPGHPGRLRRGARQRRFARRRAAGLDFWKQVVDAGNFVPVDANPGDRPGRADRAALVVQRPAHRDEMAGNPDIDVTVPASGRFGGVYVQRSASTPHPNAAKLWMEHLYSDEGQLMWLEGYCNPIRYDDMVERDIVPAELAAKLPDRRVPSSRLLSS